MSLTGTNCSAISMENILPTNILCFRNLQSHTAAASMIIPHATAADAADTAVTDTDQN